MLRLPSRDVQLNRSETLSGSKSLRRLGGRPANGLFRPQVAEPVHAKWNCHRSSIAEDELAGLGSVGAPACH